jgi:hypothetical protein
MNGLDVRERSFYGIYFLSINAGMSNWVGSGGPTFWIGKGKFAETTEGCS